VGSEVSLFKSGDEVYYAGSITRAGSNSEYQAVDERIVGKKPAGLSFEEAAALPLTTITAWEGLFERLEIEPQKTPANEASKLLSIGGAGGVGSIALQLAKQVAELTVIAIVFGQKLLDCLRVYLLNSTPLQGSGYRYQLSQ
jgi:NADPH2:quinone reductase